MKLVGALLVVGVMCNSMLAMAEGPVPFKALMQTAGIQSAVPQSAGISNNSIAASTQPARTPHMTSGGKAMLGGGIAMLAIGGAVIAVTALWASNSFGPTASSPKGAALFATGGGLAAGGITLIVLGKHRRTTE